MAHYSNKPSVTNRALLDFLYGVDKAGSYRQAVPEKLREGSGVR